MTIQTLPFTVLEKIVWYLNNKEKAALGCTSKIMQLITSYPFGPSRFSANSECWLERMKQTLFQQKRLNLHSAFHHIFPKKTMTPEPKRLPQTINLGVSRVFLEQSPTKPLVLSAIDGLNQCFNRLPAIRETVEDITELERKFAQTHYPLYHGSDLYSFLYTLIIKRLLTTVYNNSNKLPKIMHGHFTRLPQINTPQTIQEFLKEHPMDNPKQNDHDPEVQSLLLSCSPFLFSNFFTDGEASWFFFRDNRSVNPITPEKFFSMLCDRFQLLPDPKIRKKFFLELASEILGPLYIEAGKYQRERTPRRFREVMEQTGVITQIFVPREEIDMLAYACKEYGERKLGKSLSERLEQVHLHPEKHMHLQVRILAHALYNSDLKLEIFTHGYGKFFESEKIQEFLEKLDAFFLKAIGKTYETFE